MLLPEALEDVSSLVAQTPVGTLFIQAWSFCQISTLAQKGVEVCPSLSQCPTSQD